MRRRRRSRSQTWRGAEEEAAETRGGVKVGECLHQQRCEEVSGTVTAVDGRGRRKEERDVEEMDTGVGDGRKRADCEHRALGKDA